MNQFTAKDAIVLFAKYVVKCSHVKIQLKLVSQRENQMIVFQKVTPFWTIIALLMRKTMHKNKKNK